MRKKWIAHEWLQDLLIGLSCMALVAITGWVMWFLVQIAWEFRCMFGGW